tara:strand:+ start:401 stop:520 length:120 start_codon:yes stop_codon:yes gene_type:complete
MISIAKEHQEKVGLVKKLLDKGKEVPTKFWKIKYALFCN